MRDEIIAIFEDPDAASAALTALRDAGVTTARVASPAPYPAVEQTGHPGPWRLLGWIALVGGLTGLGCAMALEVITSRHLNQIVGGKPPVSWTAFGVVMFEMTLLFAGVATLVSLIVMTAVSRRGLSPRARDAVSCDRIVVVVSLYGESAERRDVITRSLGDALEVLS
ncbi:MAG: DUF3341 domain-containing protein [Kofleriaceae bacterium]